MDTFRPLKKKNSAKYPAQKFDDYNPPATGRKGGRVRKERLQLMEVEQELKNNYHYH
jgi:hypothetical protein